MMKSIQEQHKELRDNYNEWKDNHVGTWEMPTPMHKEYNESSLVCDPSLRGKSELDNDSIHFMGILFTQYNQHPQFYESNKPIELLTYFQKLINRSAKFIPVDHIAV